MNTEGVRNGPINFFKSGQGRGLGCGGKRAENSPQSRRFSATSTSILIYAGSVMPICTFSRSWLRNLTKLHRIIIIDE
jgi:hypothetical protein